MYLAKCLICCYLDLVNSSTESVGQWQEKGVQVSSQHLELIEVRRSQDKSYKGWILNAHFYQNQKKMRLTSDMGVSKGDSKSSYSCLHFGT